MADALSRTFVFVQRDSLEVNARRAPISVRIHRRMRSFLSDFLADSCLIECQNGGTCVNYRTCKCPAGFEGAVCERDVNECVEMKPCDQICYNTDGSYRCECKEGFQLQGDGQSCRKESKSLFFYCGFSLVMDTLIADDTGTTFEAKDLEFGTLDKRLLKLELVRDVILNVSRLGAIDCLGNVVAFYR